eukprot:m.35284 g.35284  ORF g.35284 m.35284 type:complete len:527 (-) comp15688_c0_seq1:35-1615(-)
MGQTSAWIFVFALVACLVCPNSAQSGDDDPCVLNPCDENAEGCVVDDTVLDGSGRRCLQCHFGYEGNGVYCNDIKGCEVNPCDDHAEWCYDVPAQLLDVLTGRIEEEDFDSESLPLPLNEFLEGIDVSTHTIGEDARSCGPCEEGYSGQGYSSCDNGSGSGSGDDTLIPRDGGWSDWTSYSACNESCGWQTASRACDNPPPANGGWQCDGASSHTQMCTTSACYVVVADFEVDFDKTFGNPADEAKKLKFEIQFLSQLRKWGVNVNKIKRAFVGKIDSSNRRADEGQVEMTTHTTDKTTADQIEAAINNPRFRVDFEGEQFYSTAGKQSSSSSGGGSDSAPIIGAVVGGVCVLVIVVFIVVRPKKDQEEKPKKKKRESKEEDVEIAPTFRSVRMEAGGHRIVSNKGPDPYDLARNVRPSEDFYDDTPQGSDPDDDDDDDVADDNYLDMDEDEVTNEPEDAYLDVDDKEEHYHESSEDEDEDDGPPNVRLYDKIMQRSASKKSLGLTRHDTDSEQVMRQLSREMMEL